MKTKRAVMMAVLIVAVAALAVPVVGLRARAAGTAKSPVVAAKGAAAMAPAATAPQARSGGRTLDNGQSIVSPGVQTGPLGKLDPGVIERLGFTRPSKGLAKGLASRVLDKLKRGGAETQSGLPVTLNASSALSAAVITTIGGRDTQFSEVTLMADWDGREDCTADREAKVDDFSEVEPDIDFTLTRAAISEHTVANGFNENIFYYGDSVGNVWVGADTNGNATVDSVLQINLPTVLNAFGSLTSDDQVTVTGIAVNPVADLTSFSNVNGAYAANFAGVTGEILYVTYHDTEGLRLAGTGQIVRSGLLAFPISDAASPAVGGVILSDVPFPITVGAAFGVAFSVFSNVAGCAVDDDGSVYFEQVDLVGLGGANIVKVSSVDSATNQDRSLAVNGILTITTLNPAGGNYGTTSGPVNQVNQFNNYSGTSTTFGNIVAITTGGCNTVYAAVARSFVATDDQFTQLTEGLFTNPAALGATPSMVISFADCSGAFDICSGLAASPSGGFINVGGIIPAANNIADVAVAGQALAAGVNNFRVFVLGNGPDIRPATGTSAIATATDLKLDMQIDFTAHAGIAVDENGGVYVISGGTPAGIGKNPSPMFTEILWFEDMCPMDRRADFVDLRGNGVPNPPASGGNVGDGDSDRFDHIFSQAPFDQVTLTPTGYAGLARGFLRYTNRLATGGTLGTGVTLGVTDPVQDDDDTDGTITFESLDPGHQVAGGDDQTTPFRGDDDNGAGTPVVTGPLSGGFEFVFGGPVGVAGCVWNGFFLNSNGNITFGTGSTDSSPNVPDLRVGPPRIAPAWADLNPDSRFGVNANLGTFPVQALGFAGVNTFRIRWINVPEFGSEDCAAAQAGRTNTFGITLFDDGTGIDENANQPLNPANPIGNNAVPFDLQEGPTDLRWTREPNTGVLVGCPPRPDGTGHFMFDYCRMDLLGTPDRPVLTGYSIGNLSPLNPPGLCEINLSEAARAADTAPFGVIQGVTASIMPCLIGEGTEPTLFEFFEDGSDAEISGSGQITLANADFDLRFEGNDAALCSPGRQRDPNRGKVGFFGIGCAPPANPLCAVVVPGPFTVGPNQTTGLVNALCSVQLTAVGCGFYPNEVTIICQGVVGNTGVPVQRPGKTVSTAMTLACDTNGDGVPESVVALGSVTPLNKNAVRGTLLTLGPQLPGTAFPLACCGGAGTLTVTTTFSAGDNNIFGPFTRTAVCTIALGVRAPVVISVTPSDGNCANPQDLLIDGACFIIPQGSVTSVFAVEFNRTTQTLNPANTIQATRIVVLSNFLIDALFNFGTVNAGKTFMVFAVGPGGTSRNLTQGQTPAGCVFGNEQGVQVTFTCSTSTQPGPGPADVAVVNGCSLTRSSSGTFSLIVTGRNMKEGAAVSVGGRTPKKVKFSDLDSSSNAFTKFRAKGKFCGGLPGAIIVTNPGTSPSQPFQCNNTCN